MSPLVIPQGDNDLYSRSFSFDMATTRGPIMAASTLYTIPPVLFFLIVRRRMVGGLVAGSVKG